MKRLRDAPGTWPASKGSTLGAAAWAAGSAAQGARLLADHLPELRRRLLRDLGYSPGMSKATEVSPSHHTHTHTCPPRPPPALVASGVLRGCCRNFLLPWAAQRNLNRLERNHNGAEVIRRLYTSGLLPFGLGWAAATAAAGFFSK